MTSMTNNLVYCICILSFAQRGAVTELLYLKAKHGRIDILYMSCLINACYSSSAWKMFIAMN